MSKYYDHFKQCIKSAKLAGFAMDGSKYRVAILKRKEDETGNTTNPAYVNYNRNITKHCNQQYCAMLYLCHVGGKYDQLRHDLENAYIMGIDNIPHTVDEMQTLLKNYTALANVKIESSGNHPMNIDANAAK